MSLLKESEKYRMGTETLTKRTSLTPLISVTGALDQTFLCNASVKKLWCSVL